MSELTREETTKLYLEKNDDYSKIPIKRGSGERLEIATAYRTDGGFYRVSVGDNIHAHPIGKRSINGELISYAKADDLIGDGWIID